MNSKVITIIDPSDSKMALLLTTFDGAVKRTNSSTGLNGLTLTIIQLYNKL